VSRITIFNGAIGGAASRLALAAHRNGDGSTFELEVGGVIWTMTPADASRLAACGRRIAGSLDHAAQRSEPVTAAPYFRRTLGSGGGDGAVFEIGVNDDGAVYLTWGERRVVDQRGLLLHVLAQIGAAVDDMRRATRASQPASAFTSLADRYQVRDLRDWRPPGSLDHDF
jgi:hypothetical protein